MRGYYLPKQSLCPVGVNLRCDTFFETERKRVTDGLVSEIITALKVNPTPSLRREIRYHLRRCEAEVKPLYLDIHGDGFGGCGDMIRDYWENGIPLYYRLDTGTKVWPESIH